MLHKDHQQKIDCSYAPTRLEGEISCRALPIGSRLQTVLVNEREARCLMEGELGRSERARELMQCIL